MAADTVTPEAATDVSEEEKEQLSDEKIKKIVAQTPGAEIFTEGMKVPGQEEREQLEAEWMRGDFDPCDDGVVYGRRLERGEGRSAEMATGPQPDEWDDLFITLRGTPVVGAEDPFFTPRGAEAALPNRFETRWLVELSNPNLQEHWAKSLRAMSRGDWCRFTCAAKKAQAWLQSLADCCEPLGGGGGADVASGDDTRVVIPSGRVPVQPCGRAMIVDVRLDRWLGCTSVAKHGQPKLFKRLLELPEAVPHEVALSKDEQLEEQLRHVGDFDREEPENEAAESRFKESAKTTGGRQRRAPRAPDRVRVQYALRVKDGERTGILREVDGTATGAGGLGNGRALDFNIGGVLEGGRKPWPVLDEVLSNMESGERASFTFAADPKRLPLGNGGGGEAPSRDAIDASRYLPLRARDEVRVGALVELDVKLVHVLRQKDVSKAKDKSVFKCKLATGKGFWRAKPPYKITFSAAAAPSISSPKDSTRPPPKSATHTVEMGAAGVPAALNDLLGSMTRHEVSLLTAPRAALQGAWPVGGPLTDEMPPATSDGSVSLWIRLDEMTRVDGYGLLDEDELAAAAACGDGQPVHKENLNGEADLQWQEKAIVNGKGEMPMLEEDVLMVFAIAAADANGKALFAADRQLNYRIGDLPFAEDWVLMMLMTMYHGEKAKITAKGAQASYLLKGACELRKTCGGCQVDVESAAKHVAAHGLVLHVTVLDQAPPEPRDGVSGAALLASAESLKERANHLLNAGYTGAAMRKYVRATWLMQDGKAEYDPALPMTEVVGVGRGDEPRKTRFGSAELLEKATALRVSLHLNLANGALKMCENYGALAAARVARTIAPGAVKPIFREAQAQIALQDFTTARELLTELLRIDPQNAAARKLRESAKEKMAEVKAATRRQFTGMFSRAQCEGPLYTKDEIERTTKDELERTQYQADRAEERRRGVQMLDTKAMSRLPEEYQQKQIDELNEAIENDHKQSEIPEGLTEEQFQRLLQMRTDGVKEEKIQREIARLRREDMEATKKHMLRTEIERMGEMQAAINRDRYKSDEVIDEREAEYREAYAEIKKRVAHRKPLVEAEEQRQMEMMKETQAILDDPEADEEVKSRAMRKMLHDPFKDLDAFLTDAEMHELNECKFRAEGDAETQRQLQGLLGIATERRIEAHIDELLDREDDVLV